MLALVLFIKLHIIEQVKRLTEPFDLVIDYDMWFDFASVFVTA